jgi:hypothetical protein
MSICAKTILANAAGSVALDVPEWGGEVRVKRWKLAELRGFNAWMEKQDRSAPEFADNFVAALVVHGVYNETGGRFFSDHDIPELLETQLGATMNKVADKVFELNKLGRSEDAKKA